jgi:PEGA domain
MNQTPTRPSSLRATAFRDGLGERRRMADATGVDKLEILCLHRDLASTDGFEQALRERAARLADFRHATFARVRTVERLSDPAATLVVASDPTPGFRLSELLQAAERQGLALDGSAEWSLIRQIAAAVCNLHEYGPVAHGAIAAERIVVTPDANAIIVEYVLGGAIERLKLSPDHLWKAFRIASPPLSPPVALNQRADVTQVGVVALSIILGRPLGDEEYPARLKELMESAWAMSAVTDHTPLPDSLRGWLSRSLQLDPRSSFATAVEAYAELEKALAESNYLLSPSDLQAFLALCQEPVELSSQAASSSQPIAAAPRPEPVVAAAPLPPQRPAAPPVAVAAPVAPVARTAPVAPVAPVAPIPFEPRVDDAAVASSPSFLSGSIVVTPTRDWKRMGIAAGLLVAVVGAGWAATNRFSEVSAERASATAPPEPPPVNLTPPAPEPMAESTPIAPLGPPTGQIEIRSTPPGATVTIAGTRRGVTPLTVSDLTVGRHTVLLSDGQGGSISRSVSVGAGLTATVNVAFETTPPPPTTGAIAISAPAAVDIFENGRLLGSSQGGRLTLPVGAHQLEIVNQSLGYRITRTVQVAPGNNAPVVLEFPKGTLALNAIPWAEVFVDGEKVGDTPIGNLPVSLGTHEVVFRNPELGEQRMTATVTLTAPTRLSVDLRKR